MKGIIKFSIFILIILLLIMLGKHFKFEPETLKIYLSRYPLILSGIIFVILYVVVTFFVWLSKDIFRVVSAILFGANISSLLVWIAEVINAYILFHFSRIMGKEFVEKKIFKEKFSYYKELLEKRSSFFGLFILRATPLVPFRFMDMFMGLSPISFRYYLLVVLLGSPLRIYWLQFILASLGMAVFKEPQKLIDYLANNKIIFIISLIYVILVIILGVKLIPKKR
jgi:uncharacterized membrane protein YdjX (TVP38/TMEM64 family)